MKTAPSAPLLSNSDIVELTDWRRHLHRYPEVSGKEAETARRVREMLVSNHPSDVIRDLGGHGVAAIYQGRGKGPTVLLRCELDALPIAEIGDLAHRSEVAGKGHLGTWRYWRRWRGCWGAIGPRGGGWYCCFSLPKRMAAARRR
jgi:metal-dependent amidase/aminoacylase/carboxypeptidase family protein